ncbi:response regulator transcription factor [Peptostreptococcus porci]|uniref:response regulator transcription factor n=1 Tax=Peptostreptococcus porci TaxID=2652282 RepID=UPI0023F199D2|nr:response regulator transcription factor [Peptostreptococcus porci]MDD7183563.1 response regulator transcription factor [Peptostreptococcus porci]MDY4128564.1 response regulator transcription factor [Peptostreptococcus porci]
MKVLIVESEKRLNNVINRYLKSEGYGVDSAFDGEEALDYLEVGSYDAIITDMRISKINGYQLVKNMRDNNINIPVLMLSSRDSIEDRVRGLNIGADDVIVKPFEFEELIARIRAIVRRQYGNTSNVLSVKNISLDMSEKSVKKGNKAIELTGKEYEVFEYLMQNKGKVISKERILEHLWGFDYLGGSNIVEVLVKNIRKKISPNDSTSIIQTKRGLGYVIRD